MEHNESFSYTYSAAQQQEVEAIRKKYLPKEENKMDQLRRLHRSATHKAQRCAITLGSSSSCTMRGSTAATGSRDARSWLMAGFSARM